MTDGSRLARWRGLLSIGFSRLLTRTIHTASRRITYALLGIAVAIGLLVVVTGIALGLATGSMIYSDDVNYWLTPDTQGGQSPLIDTDGPQFAEVHATNERIQSISGVNVATPVLTQVYQAHAASSSESLLFIGIINTTGLHTVGGVSTTGLTPGDPTAANGSLHGELVLSAGASDLLNVSTNQSVVVQGQSFTVVAVDTTENAGPGTVPTALVQLSDLQRITGADEYDQADQFLIKTNDPGVGDPIRDLYPNAVLHTRGSMATSAVFGTDMAAAIALAALLVAVVLGTLFVATTTGMETIANQDELATLSAVGLSLPSQLGIVGVQTLGLTLVGGIVGSLGGVGIAWLTNRAAMALLTTDPIAVVHPLLVPYGIGVAILVGLLALPVVLLVTRRVTGGVPG